MDLRFVTVRDRPGSLARLTQTVAAEGANVMEIVHRRAFADIGVRDVDIIVHLETRGREHLDQVIARLEREGLTVHHEVRE